MPLAVFRLLLRPAMARPYLTGIVETLAGFEHSEAVSVLVGALAEDGSRVAAEGLLRLGRPALPALALVVESRGPYPEYESDISRRKRRSALDLIAAIGIEAKEWPPLRMLLHDHDARISFFACKICVEFGPPGERAQADAASALSFPGQTGSYARKSRTMSGFIALRIRAEEAGSRPRLRSRDPVV